MTSQSTTMIDIEQGTNTTSDGDPNSLSSSRQDEKKNDNNPSDSSHSSTSLSFSIISISNWYSTINKASLFATLIFLIGLFSSALVLSLGVLNVQDNHKTIFENHSLDFLNRIEESKREFEVATLSIHRLCRKRDCTRKDFRELYEYLVAGGLEVDVIGHVYNATHDERAPLEAEAEEYFALQYPNITYMGFKGIQGPPPSAPDERPIFMRATPLPERPWYCVGHLIEPKPVFGAIDFDLCTAPPRLADIRNALSSWKPVLSQRFDFSGKGSYSVLLFNPGAPLSTEPDLQPRDVSLIMITITHLIEKAARHQRSDATVALYDSSDPSQPPMFLGSMQMRVDRDGRVHTYSLPSVELTDFHELHTGKNIYSREVPLIDKEWTIVLMDDAAIETEEYIFVFLAGAMIFFVCTTMAGWVFQSISRTDYINKLKAKAASEKAQIVLENARRATANERELNEYISHEVRNPLSAAITACSFVSSAIRAPVPLVDTESRKQVNDDINIIESSLHFINDLLRSMLDMQRISSKQLKVNTDPTDLKHDVFLPIMSMLFCRNASYDIVSSCPENLYVVTDRLRLKQILLNLVRNATKFVEKGFIRLRADVVDGLVVVSVEDSGPGVPKEKRNNLFAKYQESLDTLSQGTGMGLCLCKSLADMMGGKISLDESYVSGVENCPGARFVLELNAPPLQLTASELDKYEQKSDKSITFLLPDDPQGDSNIPGHIVSKNETVDHVQEERELPQELSVLFVDDDMVLRKLFVRAVRKVAPNWNVQEASSGETALLMVDSNRFDLIFMDQYMASVEKQLLGTETTHQLRQKGVVDSIICGLSANDAEQAFYDAGADYFIFKPIPCKPDDLKSQLSKVLFSKESRKSSLLL